MTNPRNFVKQIDFNDRGYAMQIISALGQPEQQLKTFVREPLTNLLLSSTDALNRTSQFTYDGASRVATITRAVGTVDETTVGFTYEPVFGNLATYTDPCWSGSALRATKRPRAELR